MERKKPITKRGAAQLREELQRLKNEERPKIKEALKTAREHGDLSENAEYKAAREQQGFNEGRIKEIELCLSFCEVIDVATVQHNGRIVFGATVTLYDEAEDRRMTCQIVGEPEADMKANRVSITSPIARALIGKGEGDTAVVNAPGGDKTWVVEKIAYAE